MGVGAEALLIRELIVDVCTLLYIFISHYEEFKKRMSTSLPWTIWILRKWHFFKWLTIELYIVVYVSFFLLSDSNVMVFIPDWQLLGTYILQYLYVIDLKQSDSFWQKEVKIEKRIFLIFF